MEREKRVLGLHHLEMHALLLNTSCCSQNNIPFSSYMNTAQHRSINHAFIAISINTSEVFSSMFVLLFYTFLPTASTSLAPSNSIMTLFAFSSFSLLTAEASKITHKRYCAINIQSLMELLHALWDR